MSTFPHFVKSTFIDIATGNKCTKFLLKKMTANEKRARFN